MRFHLAVFMILMPVMLALTAPAIAHPRSDEDRGDRDHRMADDHRGERAQGCFVPTILDTWAFFGVPRVICPQGVVVVPRLVSPLQIVSPFVIPVTAQGCFVPTILDMWAFFGVPRVICPQGVVVVPRLVSPLQIVSPFVIPVTPLFVDPPAVQPPVPGSSAAGSAQPPVHILATGAAPPPITVTDLARAPTRYYRQVVSVIGTVAAYEERFTDRDARYAVFRLEEGGTSIPVVVWGHPGLRPGLRVRVTGTFHDVAPFALSGGDRPQDVLEAQIVARSGGEAQAR